MVNFRDAMDGTQLENRAAFHVFSFLIAVEDVQILKDKMSYVKELDLKPLWKDIFNFQTAGGDEIAA